MNNNNIRITYPDSEKVYMQGSLHPDVRVGMRKVSLTGRTATLRQTLTCGAVCPGSAKSGYWNGRWSSCLR